MSELAKNKPLNQEEIDLEKALDSLDVTKLAKPDLNTQKKLKEAAMNFVKKETKMNIRIDSFELNEIKKRAAIEGLKYQSFVKSVLHKYITGQLIERKSANN